MRMRFERIGLKKNFLKWHTSEYGLKTGDFGWIIDDASPRGHYLLTRVTTPNYGNDGVMSSAVIRTLAGEYTRPTMKFKPVLAPLGAKDVGRANR